MTQPKYYFQGFEGARKVQSMMIDFPEITWMERERPIKHMQLYSSKNPDNNLIEIFAINNISGGISRIYANDTETKIFVAPECEGFFQPKIDDKLEIDCDGHGNIFCILKDDAIWVKGAWGTHEELLPLRTYSDLLESIISIKRNGKRIWMPQTDMDVGL